MERLVQYHQNRRDEHGVRVFAPRKPVIWSVPGLTFHSPAVRPGALGELIAYGIREYPWPLSADDAARLRSEEWCGRRAWVIDDHGIKASTVGLAEARRHVYAVHVVLRPAVREPLVCRLSLADTRVLMISVLSAIDAGSAESYSVAREWKPIGVDAETADALYIAPKPRA